LYPALHPISADECGDPGKNASPDGSASHRYANTIFSVMTRSFMWFGAIFGSAFVGIQLWFRRNPERRFHRSGQYPDAFALEALF